MMKLGTKTFAAAAVLLVGWGCGSDDSATDGAEQPVGVADPPAGSPPAAPTESASTVVPPPVGEEPQAMPPVVEPPAVPPPMVEPPAVPPPMVEPPAVTPPAVEPPAAGGAPPAAGGAPATAGAPAMGGAAAMAGAPAGGAAPMAGAPAGGAPAPGGKKKMMFIGAKQGDENWGWDKYIIPKLEEWGYPMDRQYTRQDLLDGLTEADYAKYDFIFLSETMDTRIPGLENLRDIPLPMVNSDGFAGRPEGLAYLNSERGIYEELLPLVFLDSGMGHPLAAGFTPGTVVQPGGRGEETCFQIWGRPQVESTIIAALDRDPTQTMIYGIEKGTMNLDGQPMKHRVANIGFHSWCYDNLTADGEKLMNAAIDWVLAEPQ